VARTGKAELAKVSAQFLERVVLQVFVQVQRDDEDAK